MTEKKGIEAMMEAICKATHFKGRGSMDLEKTAKALVELGYGNIKQYQERIEELERELDEIEARNYRYEYQTDDETVAEAKKKAVKEFMDKIEHVMQSEGKCGLASRSDIDGVYKEMYGE